MSNYKNIVNRPGRRSFLWYLAVLGGVAVALGANIPFAAAQSGGKPAIPLAEEKAPAANRYRASYHRNRRPLVQTFSLTSPVSLAIAAELGINYADGAWQLGVVDLTTETEYAPWEAALLVASAAREARPAGPEWDFLGVPAGATISVLPQFQTAGLLYLAFSAEDTEAGTWVAYDVTNASGGRTGGVAPWVRLQLVNVFGPGDFSVWSSDSFGDSIIWMASANGISLNDAVWTPEGEDIHVNFGFTKPGFYRVVFLASAYKPGHFLPTVSRPVVYRFRVE